MTVATVEQLYKNFSVLDEAKDDIAKHEDSYLSILSAVKGGSNERRLASQFLARFFHKFPHLSNETLSAIIDLCEDNEVAIRKQAIKDLPTLVKTGQLISAQKVTDLLTQCYITDDEGEIAIINRSLYAMLNYNCKGTLEGIFGMFKDADEKVRHECIKFMSAKLKSIPEALLTKEVEDMIVAESIKILQDVTADEFEEFLQLLSCLKSMSTVQGRNKLVTIVAEQADLDKEFDPADGDAIDRLSHCVRAVQPMFSKNVHSTQYVSYIIEHVLPVLDSLQVIDESEGQERADKVNLATAMQEEILRLLAEIYVFCGPMANMTSKLEKVFNALIAYMPLPPENESDVEPEFKLSIIECLMYLLHQLGKQNPEFLASEDKAERNKDFKIRLQYVARGCQNYIKHLRQSLQDEKDGIKSDQGRIKIVALKLTNNLNTMIKDLFHSPPSYKAIITFSWKAGQSIRPPASSTESGVGKLGKRGGITPISLDNLDEPKKQRTEQKRYQPPTGKYSFSAGIFNPGRGQFRGRGRGRRGRW